MRRKPPVQSGAAAVAAAPAASEAGANTSVRTLVKHTMHAEPAHSSAAETVGLRGRQPPDSGGPAIAANARGNCGGRREEAAGPGVVPAAYQRPGTANSAV